MYRMAEHRNNSHIHADFKNDKDNIRITHKNVNVLTHICAKTIPTA